jgi:hypothetical protein
MRERSSTDVDSVVAKRHCVFHHAGHAVKVGNVAERDDEVVVFELELARTEPRTDRYDLAAMTCSGTGARGTGISS